MDIEPNIHFDAVEQAKTQRLWIVPPDTPVRDVFVRLQQHGVGSLLICQDRKLVGIFTERDALKLMAEGADLDVPVGQVMTRDPVTISREEPIAEAIRRMSAGGYRRLPIVDQDRNVVGVVKVSGIVHYLADHFPAVVFNLPPEPNVVVPEREGA